MAKKINFSKIKVLVVDDYQTMLKIVGNLLRQIGLQHIDEATSGETALEKLKNESYDLVISDWIMEPMSGLELLKNIRVNKETQNTPFMMITADSNAEHDANIKEAGAHSLIVKPFSANTLKDKIESMLRLA